MSSVNKEDQNQQQAALMTKNEERLEVQTAEKAPKDLVVVDRLKTIVMVSMGLVNPKFVGLKAELLNVPEGENSWNCFSPFKKKKNDEDEGVIRPVLNILFPELGEHNNSKIILLGKPSEQLRYSENFVSEWKKKVEGRFAFLQDDAIVLASSDEGEHPYIRFADIVRIKTWVSYEDAAEPLVRNVNAVLHLQVNSSAFYNAKDKHVYLKQLEKLLGVYSEINKVEVILGIQLDTEWITDPHVRDLMDVLIEEQFILLNKRSFLDGVSSRKSSSWHPTTKRAVNDDLFMDQSDLLVHKKL